jgi:hypothetical protein
MALENAGWGAPRVHGELLKLGFTVDERTVSRYMPKRPPDPGAVQRWITFLRNHKDGLAGMDFFTVPSVVIDPGSPSMMPVLALHGLAQSYL